MRDVEEVNARALASLADAPRRTARRRPRRARRVMRASWFVACVVALSAASRGAGAACAVESDGVRWCQVASSSTPSGLNITYAHAPGAATLDVRVRATFSGAHDPGSAGWIALGPGSGMMSGEVVVASGGAGSAATYYQLTGQSQPSTLCGAACALSAANVTAATGSRTVVVRYRDANASAGATKSFVYASSPSLWPAQHTTSRRGGLSINFATGDATSMAMKSAIKRDVTHGVLMLVAWGVLMPTASAAPRMKFLFPDGKWFLMHQIGVVVGAVVFVTAGAMLLAQHDEREDAHSESSTFDAHSRIGVAVGFLWLAQFLLGAFRPNKNVTDSARFGFIPSSWRKAWFLTHASLGPITIGLASVVLVLGAVLIRDKYVGETDSGVKFLADGGVYGIMAAVWLVCAFGAWRDGFAKAKGGLENYGLREPTPSESERNAREMRFTGITVSRG